MQHGLNSTSVQKANRSLVIKIMLSQDSVSRVELVRATGLRKATITNIVNEFLEMGIIHEEGYAKVEDGRRAEAFKINVPQLVIVSIRFTRRFYRITVYDLTGTALQEHQGDIGVDQDIHTQIESVINKTEDMLMHYKSDNVLGMCIALPGPYIRRKGKNVAIVTGFSNLSKIDVERTFRQRFSFKVLTEHDAKLAAFAEWKHVELHSNLRENNLLQIQSIGIGVGSGAVINGRILEGAVGVAGEIGHMGINFNGPKNDHDNRGAFEHYAGTEACTRYLAELIYQYPNSCLCETSKYKEILQAYYAGDSLAIAVVQKLAFMLGYGIASLAFVLNPNTVVIGDDYPQSENFLTAVKQVTEQLLYEEVYESMCIRYSSIQQDTTMLGGYYYIVEHYVSSNCIIDKIRNAVVCT